MLHQPLPAFAATEGAAKPRIVLLGEAWGADEDSYKRPFVGAAGRELFQLLGEAMPQVEPELHARIAAKLRYGDVWLRYRREWLEAAGIAITNVLAFRPPGNSIDALCVKKGELAQPRSYPVPEMSRGKYLGEQFLGELDRLREELTQWQPNLVVALGGTASWALLHTSAIGSVRGVSTQAVALVPGQKVLPTYHPAAILRQWQLRPIALADLIKAQGESKFPEIRRPARRILVNPTLEQVRNWTEETLALAQAALAPPLLLSADIETAFRQITCIGFARAIDSALVIPFVDKSRPGWNYWNSADAERGAWDCVERLLTSPHVEVLGQNFMYDMQYINPLGISVARVRHDTMLLHHSMYPELQKGLGFLGSCYTNESSWKMLRRFKPDSEKRDE